MDRRSVRREVVNQVEDLVAKRYVERWPSGRDGFSRFKLQRPISAQPDRISDGTRSRVIAKASGDPTLVGEQPEEPPAIAPNVENPAA
ncbi:MAG TPA: hypothetical protein VGL78_18900 [Solirubrobacteraceae bacterium]|jgi:hypothetical protein